MEVGLLLKDYGCGDAWIDGNSPIISNVEDARYIGRLDNLGVLAYVGGIFNAVCGKNTGVSIFRSGDVCSNGTCMEYFSFYYEGFNYYILVFGGFGVVLKFADNEPFGGVEYVMNNIKYNGTM